MSEREHFHQSAIARAHERAATLKADQAAAQQAAAEHLASQATTPTSTAVTGG